MRQPVEEGMIRINRNLEEIVFPADVMVVIAANPCKCGNLWDDRKICTCTPRQIAGYQRKLAGPFSDRIDMHIKVAAVPRDQIFDAKNGVKAMSSAEMRQQVQFARAIQAERYDGTGVRDNGSLNEQGITEYCDLEKPARNMISNACESLGLTMRACSRILKISRTIADLAGVERIDEEHVAEALAYRTAVWETV